MNKLEIIRQRLERVEKNLEESKKCLQDLQKRSIISMIFGQLKKMFAGR